MKKWSLTLFIIVITASGVTALADSTPEEEAIVVEVTEPPVTSIPPASGMETIATDLRYEPLVDLQTRNVPEAQGDLSIRGGTFENSGVKIGGATFFDPQTGHYLLEIPVSPAMLTGPVVLTGLENVVDGADVAGGTVAWKLREITESTGNFRFSGGDFGTFVEEGYVASHNYPGQLNTDIAYSRSDSNGSRKDCDSEFDRVSGRLQWAENGSQVDLLAGYQGKDYAWPYLYAPKELHDAVGSSGIESEALHTSIFLFNYRQDYGRNGSYFELSPSYRRNRDDYEFDKEQKGLFNPFQHTTSLWGTRAEGRHEDSGWRLNYSAEVQGDSIDSTALVFGDFTSRTYYRAAALPGLVFDIDGRDSIVTEAGAAWTDTNRDPSRVSPLGGLSLERKYEDGKKGRVFAEIAQASQVQGYTALASNPAAGLFRGNPDLAPTLSTTYETGVELKSASSHHLLGAFYRHDKDLLDWTFESATPLAARVANNLDLGTTGIEALTQQTWNTSMGVLETSLGYTWLHKDADYHTVVDGSFYALNFPTHRVTGGVMFRPVESVEIRLDAEFRKQFPDKLRLSPDTTYILASASVSYFPSFAPYLSIGAVVDNIGNEHFEEVPGVPGSGRFAAGFVKVVL